MKKYLYIAAALVIALVSCNKNNVDNKTNAGNSSVPAWVSDESLPVPVLFSQGDLFEAKTKAGLIQSIAPASNLVYGVTALDLSNPELKLFQTSDYHVEAKNIESNDLSSGSYLAQFVNKTQDPGTGDIVYEPTTYYYPLMSKQNGTYKAFTFFGYRTVDEDNASTSPNFPLTWSTDSTAFVNGVEIGYQDILWAKASAKGGLTETSGANLYGFNASYIRAAWEAVSNVPSDFYANWAPKLNFNHITTAFQFVVVTDQGRGGDDDAGAKKFENADIYVKSLYVGGLHTVADLFVTEPTWNDLPDINTGDIEPIDATKLWSNLSDIDDIDIVNVVNPTVTRTVEANTLYWQDENHTIAGHTETSYGYVSAGQQTFTWDQYYPQYTGSGVNGDPQNGWYYGDPIMVLPSDVEEAAGNTDNPTATIVFNVPNSGDEEITLTLRKPAEGFEVGKRYIFTILVHSPEEIEVVTTLEPWVDVDFQDSEGDLEIG